nr:MAG TPA: hypothetical protein [Bacteriophage sp.]
MSIVQNRDKKDNVVKTISEPDNGSSRSLWEKYTLLTRRKQVIHKRVVRAVGRYYGTE